MSNDEVNAQTVVYFEDLPKSYILDGLKILEERLKKCIELKGDYVEKLIICFSIFSKYLLNDFRIFNF